MNKRTIKNIPGLGKLAQLVQFASAGEFANTALAMPEHDKAPASSWNGNTGTAECARMINTGDLSSVPASDKLLDKFSKLLDFGSHAFQTIDAVCGGLPNVPAYLAGSPLAMRQRVRRESAMAPMAIVVECVSSGSISGSDIHKRGIAVLALVRALAGRRPVTLWLAGSMKPSGAKTADGDKLSSVCLAVPIDTAPLDLARAAHLLSHTGVSRAVAYRLGSHITAGAHNSIHWPDDDFGAYKSNCAAAWCALLGTDPADTLVLPPVHGNDDCITQPVQWLADQVAKYGKAPE